MNTRTLLCLLALGAGTLGTPAAFAADASAAATTQAPRGDAGCRHGREHRGPETIDLKDAEARAKTRFDAIDTNHDGRIDAAEFAAAPPPGMGDMHDMRGHMRRMHGDHERHARGCMDQGPGPGERGPRERGMAMHDGMPGAPGSPMGPDGEMYAKMLQGVFARLDANRDQRLDANEFAKLHDAMRGEMRAQMFARIDANHDGSLSREEFPPMLARLRALDANHDGKVTRDEFPRRADGASPRAGMGPPPRAPGAGAPAAQGAGSSHH